MFNLSFVVVGYLNSKFVFLVFPFILYFISETVLFWYSRRLSQSTAIFFFGFSTILHILARYNKLFVVVDSCMLSLRLFKIFLFVALLACIIWNCIFRLIIRFLSRIFFYTLTSISSPTYLVFCRFTDNPHLHIP